MTQDPMDAQSVMEFDGVSFARLDLGCNGTAIIQLEKADAVCPLMSEGERL